MVIDYLTNFGKYLYATNFYCEVILSAEVVKKDMDMDTGKYISHVLLKECTTPFPRRCSHLLECVLYGSVTTAACVLHEQRS